MTELYITLGALGALLVAFLLVLLIRTAMFRPKKEEIIRPETVTLDGEKAISDLAEMIRCRTVSDKERENEDEGEFVKFKALLPTLFPTVYEKCTVEYPSDRSILIRWEGVAHDAPTVLMSHYDVVSVVEEDWEKPPFDGILENGLLWGRGTLDTKGTLNGILQSAEALIKSGFVPKNDVYFAFEYPFMNDVMRIVKEEEPEILEQAYDMDCLMRLRIRRSLMPKLCARLEKVESLRFIEEEEQEEEEIE